MNSSSSKKAGRVFYGWWIVAASFVMFIFCGGTYYYGFTAFFNPMVDEFGWTYTATSLAFSLRSVEMSFLAPVVGLLIDRFGPRKMILMGVVAMGGGMVMMSSVHSIGMFYIAFLVTSLGSTAGFGIAQYAAVANWFVRRRALAMGVLSAGYGVCGTLAPVMVLLIRRFGWRPSLLMIGVALWVVCIPLALLIRHRPEPYGYLPDGGDAPAPALPAADSQVESDPGPSAGEAADFGIVEALRTPTFWLLVAFSGLTGFAQSALGAHEMPYLTSVGLSRGLAALTMTGITLHSLIGRLGFPILSSRTGKRRLLAVAGALQSVGVFIFAFVSDRASWLLIPFLLTYAPGFGGPIPLVPALQVDYFGLKTFAAVQGLLWIGGTVSGIVGPLFAGWMFDITGTYRLAWVIMAALSGCGALVVLLVKPPVRRLPPGTKGT